MHVKLDLCVLTGPRLLHRCVRIFSRHCMIVTKILAVVVPVGSTDFLSACTDRVIVVTAKSCFSLP